MALVTPDKTVPTRSSSGDDWIQWHKDLKRFFGKKDANTIWSAAWDKRESSSANTRELRSYMERQGIDIDTSGFLKGTDSALDFMDFIGNIFKVSGIVGLVVVIAILSIIGVALFNVAKNPEAVGKGVGTGLKMI
jgi:hypothetical protein